MQVNHIRNAEMISGWCCSMQNLCSEAVCYAELLKRKIERSQLGQDHRTFIMQVLCLSSEEGFHFRKSKCQYSSFSSATLLPSMELFCFLMFFSFLFFCFWSEPLSQFFLTLLMIFFFKKKSLFLLPPFLFFPHLPLLSPASCFWSVLCGT